MEILGKKSILENKAMNEVISVQFPVSKPARDDKKLKGKSVLMRFLLQRLLDALGYTFEPFSVYLIRNELLGNPHMLMGPSHDLECLVL